MNTPHEDGYAMLMALAVANNSRLVDIWPEYVATMDEANRLREMWADLMERLEEQAQR